MTSGWGVDATITNNVITSGTTSTDVRKVWGALYTPGIISGCAITRSGSAMTYTIASGVVAISPTIGEVIMAPVQGAVVTTAPAPGTGTRVDVVYATQRQPASGDSNVALSVVSFATEGSIVAPAASQELGRFLVSAGQTNTNAAAEIGDVKYSIPYGGSLGVIHYWQNKYDGILSRPILREGYGTYNLPTDRLVRYTYRSVLSAVGAAGWDNSKYCEYGYLFNSDRIGGSGDFVIHTTPGLHQAWATYQFDSLIVLPAGPNTFSMAGTRMVGPGDALQHYGFDGTYGRRGGEFIVEDLGPADYPNPIFNN
jgi:hypothetical protein